MEFLVIGGFVALVAFLTVGKGVSGTYSTPTTLTNTQGSPPPNAAIQGPPIQILGQGASPSGTPVSSIRPPTPVPVGRFGLRVPVADIPHSIIGNRVPIPGPVISHPAYQPRPNLPTVKRQLLYEA